MIMAGMKLATMALRSRHLPTCTLDRLAAKGVKLDNYYVQPICSPTRSQLLSGRYQIHTGLQHSIIRPPKPSGLPLKDPTIANKLKEQGYATHMVGKWHIGFYKKEFTPTERGFDSFFGYLTGAEDYFTHHRCYLFDTKKGKFNACGLDLHADQDPSNHTGEYSTHLFTKQAQRVIEQHAKSHSDQPLFLYLPFQAVHGPLQVPSEYEDKYASITNKQRRKYAGMVSCMDEAVDNVTQTLQKHGLWDNTILVFSTDNGGQPKAGGNNWPLRGCKATLWEGGMRGVGFVHSALLNNTGVVNKELIHVSDWFPTLLHVAGGVSEGLELDGFNVWDTISLGEPSPRKELLHNIDPLKSPAGERLFNHTFDNRVQAAIRYGQWKLITGDPGEGAWTPQPNATDSGEQLLSFDDDHDTTFTQESSDKPTKNLWLFDILADPLEKNDLSDFKPTVVKMLLDRLAYYNSTAVPCQWPMDAAEADPRKHGGVWGPWEN